MKILALALLALVACSTPGDLDGTWVADPADVAYDGRGCVYTMSFAGSAFETRLTCERQDGTPGVMTAVGSWTLDGAVAKLAFTSTSCERIVSLVTPDQFLVSQTEEGILTEGNGITVRFARGDVPAGTAKGCWLPGGVFEPR